MNTIMDDTQIETIEQVRQSVSSLLRRDLQPRRRGAHTKLAIFDATGRTVRTLVEGPVSRGEHRALWQGRDDHGRDVPAGLYFCSLRAGSRSVVHRVFLVR